MARGTRRGDMERKPNGRWRARYTGPDGRRRSKTFDRKAHAEAWLSSVFREIDSGTWLPPEVANAEIFGAYLDSWLATRVTSKGAALRPKTLQGYEGIRRRAFGLFERMRIADITPALIRGWHAKRSRVGVTQAAREAALLRAVLQTAVTDGVITRNPVDKNLTRGSSGLKHRPPTLEELARLVELMPDEWRAAVLIAAFGGLRLSEWRALRRCDLELVTTETGARYMVNVERQAIRITGKGWVVGPPKSDEGVRVVPLPQHLTEAIQHHLNTYTGPFRHSLLFAPKGESEFIDDKRFNEPWTLARAKLRLDGVDGVVVREHDLRAFAGTVFAQTGATMREVQAHLGHANLASAAVYQATTGRGGELADLMPALPATTPPSIITPLHQSGGN